MTTIRLNSTGVEWVVYDKTIDAYWKQGQQWTTNEAFARTFDSSSQAVTACERELMLNPQVDG